ncbi:MAG TPA: hypothetical protein VK628_03480 [Flavitalea sp.]|nr:hypothetical protein [Flavitalea sp.]
MVVKVNFEIVKNFIFCLCLLTLPFFSQAQKIDSLLQVLDARYPQEKLYLHFDKDYYNPGETIWFKAYLFAGNVPSQISTTIYAELIDENGKVIERKTAPVVMSSASAAFDLSEKLTSSTLYIRAYTDWMLNFDTSFLYQKAIPIVQPKKSAKTTPAPRSFLQFFPESGELVTGIPSKVAFKATDLHGLPYNVKGNVVGENGKAIAEFSSVHDGMGFFLLVPEAGETYKAVWKDASGKTQNTELPKVATNGIVLQVQQDTGNIRYAITRSGPDQLPGTTVTIVAQMQQQMVYMARANLSEKKSISSSIPLSGLPAGIVQITVITSDNKPIAERLIYVNKQDYYFITDLNLPLKGLQKRKRNVVQIDVPDTIKTNLSVSITDADVNPRQEGEEDIFSNVLLTSDIKGYVHNPGYYFSSEADSVARHLDLVMMTNGWRRFKWEDVLAGNWPKIKRLPEQYLSVNGKINGLTRAQLVQQDISGILEIDKKQQFISIPVDPQGNFKVADLLFYDTAKLYYQLNKDKDKVLTSRASFDIKNNLLKTAVPFDRDSTVFFRLSLPGEKSLLQNKELTTRFLEAIAARRKVQTLEKVTITAKVKSKKELMDDQYTSGLFRGGDGYTFITEDDPLASSSFSVLTYLQGKVAGLQITGAGAQMTMSWRGGSPTVFMDEMQTDISQVQSIPMSDVAMIKVFRPPFIGGSGGGAGGAIAVYTKKGASLNKDVKGLDFVRIPGYSVAKEFYSPDYSKYDETQTQGDFRSTLYWNPFVLTDKDTRRVVFTFYNNDISKRFRIVVEGCDVYGKLTRIEKIFE